MPVWPEGARPQRGRAWGVVDLLDRADLPSYQISISNSSVFAARVGASDRTALLLLDMGHPDDLAPSLGLVRDELAEMRGRGRQRGSSQVRELCLQFGIARPSFTAPLSLSMISGGVWLGMPSPNELLTS